MCKISLVIASYVHILMVFHICFFSSSSSSSIDSSDNDGYVDHFKAKDWMKWYYGAYPTSKYNSEYYQTPSPLPTSSSLASKIGSRTYLALPSWYSHKNLDRNSLEYSARPGSYSEEIPNVDIYQFKKHDHDHHYHHQSHEPHHHYDQPAPHINVYSPPHSESKQVYLPIPIEQAPVKKFDFSFWIWPLVFVIILPLVLGAILLPLALVFLMNLIFLLFTMRNNTTMLADGQFNRVQSKDKDKRTIEKEDALNQLFISLIESYEKYNPNNKTKL